MTRRLIVSAGLGAAIAAAFGAGFLIVAAPLSVAAAAVLRHIEGNQNLKQGRAMNLDPQDTETDDDVEHLNHGKGK